MRKYTLGLRGLIAAGTATSLVSIAAAAAMLGGTGSASASPTAASDPQCQTKEEALACVDALRKYIETTGPLPTTPPTTGTGTTSPTTPPTTGTGTTSPTTPPTTPQYASGMPWNSGAFTAHKASEAVAFEKGRGRTLDHITVFPSRESWSNMQNTWFLDSQRIPAGFKGNIIVGVPLWPQDSNIDYDSTAQWQKFAKTLAARDPKAIVRLGWEMNIPGWYYKVTPANKTKWIANFNRSAKAIKAVAPNMQIVFNPNWGADQTGVDSREVFQAVKSNVDIYAIDMYDEWPPDTSDAAWQQRLTQRGGLGESLEYARANGKKFALGEWGVGCTTAGCQWQGHAGGDNPRYITNTLNYLAQNRKDVAFESYFHEPMPYLKSELFTTSTNPKASAAYKAALTQIAGS